jgi:hypothetical protein
MESIMSDINTREAMPHDDLAMVGDIYHHFYVGILLALANRAGAARGAEVVYRAFRRQQKAKFLPGLEKLGLLHLPPAVACAQCGLPLQHSTDVLRLRHDNFIEQRCAYQRAQLHFCNIQVVPGSDN